MHQARPQQSGFTIVELIMVIVVIGILATLTLVTYTGISQKALVVALKSDLVNSSDQLKLFDVDNGHFPTTISTDCAAQPDSSTNKCLKASPDTTYTYSSPAPYSTFTLVATRGSTNYMITDSSSPQVAAVFTSGGTISEVGGIRTHIFALGSYNLTAILSGTITIDVLGAGGGGGGEEGQSGDNGGLSSFVNTTLGKSYISYGGSGGTSTPGSNGSASTPVGFTNTASPIIGGGSAGSGGSNGGDYCGGGAEGGNGGRATGTFVLTAGQTIQVNVGQGGLGGPGSAWNGCSDGETEGGGPGTDGFVTISYPN